MWLPTDAPTIARISFFGSRVTRFVRDPSCHIKTPTWISMRRSTSKGDTGNGLLIAFLEESHKSTSSISTGRLCSDSLSGAEALGSQKNKTTTRKGTLSNHLNSRASHPLHSYAVGYYSQSKYDVPRDWLREACHMARVRWETRCKGFCSKEGLHYWMEQSVRNQLERDQVQRALEKLSDSCLQSSNNQPYSQGRKSLGDSSLRLYCIDLAEAYVMQENVSSRI